MPLYIYPVLRRILLPRTERRIGFAASTMASLSRVWKDKRRTVSTRIRLYHAVVVLVMVYAAETWTLLAADVRSLEAFCMRCQRQILRIRWYDYIWNDEVAFHTGLPPIMDHILNRRCALFGHIAHLPKSIPANQALCCHVDPSLGRPPQRTWRCRPGRPRNSWLEQIRQDSGSSSADLWHTAVI